MTDEQIYTPAQLEELRALLAKLKKERAVDVDAEMLIHIANKTDISQLRTHVERRRFVGVMMTDDGPSDVYSDQPEAAFFSMSEEEMRRAFRAW